MLFRVMGVVVALAFCSIAAAEGTDVDAKIDAIFERYNHPDSPGAVVGVVKDGAVIFAKAYGMDNIAAGKPLSPASRMNLGSVSKQFAAASIILLAQDGKLSLGDDIRKWLPEMPDYGTLITIRHLAHHTSGLRDYLTLFNLAGIGDDSPFGNQEAFDAVVRQKELNYKPGDEYLYSNTGYLLLAIIVKRASGKTLTEFAQERIFTPLGMTETCWDTDLSLYTDVRALSYPSRGVNIAPANRLDVVEGDGNVMTTVGDMAKWDQNFYDPKVGGAALITQILEREPFNDGKMNNYAFGVAHDTLLGRPIVRHGGSWLGFRSGFTRFPEEHLSIIVLGNVATMEPDTLIEQVAALYLGAAQDEPSPEKSDTKGLKLKRKELKAKVGKYFVNDTGTLGIVAAEDDVLSVTVDGIAMPLIAVDATHFRPAHPTSFAALSFDADEPTSMTVTSPSGRTQFAPRVPDDGPAPKPEDLVGAYYSPEINCEYTIAVNNGVAEVTRPNTKPAKLEPIYGDWFRANFRYRFEHDASGKITGFRISAGRVKNVLFVRR